MAAVAVAVQQAAEADGRSDPASRCLQLCHGGSRGTILVVRSDLKK